MSKDNKSLHQLENNYIKMYGKDDTYSLIKEILNSRCVKLDFKFRLINHLLKRKQLTSPYKGFNIR